MKDKVKISIAEEREKARKIYRTFSPVYCPYLKTDVTFPSESFNHLMYKSARSERGVGSQLIRYKLLHLAPEIIKKSSTLQEYDEGSVWVDKKKGEKVLKRVEYWGFIAIVKGIKTKVIVKKIGEGEYKYWSIIPNWTSRKRGDKKFRNYTGNLELD